MNFLDILCNNLGIDTAGLDTDEKKMAQIMPALLAARANAAIGVALMGKLGAKTQDEAMATLATMVPRADLSAKEKELATMDSQLVLLEGQMSGKLTAAECTPEGWAGKTAAQSPQVLRSILPTLQTKVATGAAIKAMVGSLQTVEGANVVGEKSGTAKQINVKGAKFNLTEKTQDYADADLANLQDNAERYGAEAMVKQGLLAFA